MNVFVVIPNWNGADLIAECLDSLQAQTLKAKIVVVDNGSVDESISIIESKYPDVVLLKQPKNLGFAGGVNVGIRYAMTENATAVALFNNDAVANPHWLENLVKSLEENPKAGIVTGKLLRQNKKHIDSTGDFYSIWGMPFPRDRNHVDSGQRNAPEKVFGASGGASLYRSSMINDIGFFDDRFFAYYEDVDISFRAQLAGWKVIYEPTAVAYHHMSATSSKLGSFTRYHATKNFYLLYAKNMPGWLYWKYLPLFTIQAIRLAASSLIKGGFWPFLKGTVKAFLLTPHIIRERRRIQTKRKVPVTYIDSILYKKRPPKIPKIT
jgi:GT2 family glycosyltransferase